MFQDALMTNLQKIVPTSNPNKSSKPIELLRVCYFISKKNKSFTGNVELSCRYTERFSDNEQKIEDCEVQS